MGLAIALSTMAKEFGVGETDVQWALSAYLLAFASALIVGGRFADLFGHKRMALCGLALFGGASLIGGLAPSLPLLIGARVLQGIGAAFLTPATLSIVRATVPGERLGPAIGAITAISAVGVAAGPLVGGAVTDLLGWRWVFFMNVPTVLFAATMVVLFVREHRDPNVGRSIDWLGLVTIVGSVAAVTLVIDFGREWGWLSRLSLGILTLGVLLFVAFLLIEHRVKEPLIDLTVFRHIHFRRIAGIGSAANFSLAMPVPVFAIYTQTVLDMDPFLAGITLLPFSIAGVAGGPASGRLFRRFGPRLPLVLAIGLAGGALVLFNPAENTVSWLPLLLLLAAMGFGSNGSYSTTNMGTQAVLEPRLAGEASGTVLTGLVLAAAIGVTLASELMEHYGEGAAAVSHTTTVGGWIAIGVATLALGLIPGRLRRRPPGRPSLG